MSKQKQIAARHWLDKVEPRYWTPRGQDMIPVARFEAADKDAGKLGIKKRVADSIEKLNKAASFDAKQGATTVRFVAGSHEMRRRIEQFSSATWEVGNSPYPILIGELR